MDNFKQVSLVLIFLQHRFYAFSANSDRLIPKFYDLRCRPSSCVYFFTRFKNHEHGDSKDHESDEVLIGVSNSSNIFRQNVLDDGAAIFDVYGVRLTLRSNSRPN